MALPDFPIELETMTAMYDGTVAGGGVLLPGSVVQLVPHDGFAGLSSNPLKPLAQLRYSIRARLRSSPSLPAQKGLSKAARVGKPMSLRGGVQALL
jgi:hypothetical protein